MNNLFEYKVKKRDKSIESVRLLENDYGYSECNPREFSNDYIDFADNILNDKSILSNCTPSKKGFSITYIKNSKRIWKDLNIKLHRVYYLNPDYKINDEYLVLNNELYENIKSALPTNVPISITDNLLESGPYYILAPGIEGNYSLFFKIALPRYEKNYSSIIFAHEVTHMELLATDGVLTSLTDSETIPMFCEFLFADLLSKDGSLLELDRNYRFVNIASSILLMIKEKNKMNFETRMKYETYLISMVQAMNLFNKYAESSNSIKREILDSISKMFNAKKSVNDVLTHFDSKFDIVKPNLEQFRKIKKISR